MRLEARSLEKLSIHFFLGCALVGALACDLNKNIGEETDTGDGQTGGDDDGQTGGDDGQTGGDDGGQASLEGRDFISQEVSKNDAPHELVPGTSLRIGFDETGHGVWASAGCNTLSGEYDYTDGMFSVTNAGSTEIGCEPDLAEQETWYFEFLGQSSALTVTDEELILDDGSTYIRYLDSEIATPDLDLVGQVWVVDTIIEEDGASHADWPEPATLEFADDGTVAAYSGCNSGGGEYVTSGAEIQFSGMGFTEMACVDQVAQDLEDAVLRTLVNDTWMSWEIDASTLTIQNGIYGLVLKAQS